MQSQRETFTNLKHHPQLKANHHNRFLNTLRERTVKIMVNICLLFIVSMIATSIAAPWQDNPDGCGRIKEGPSQRIIGGEPAAENAWPWQVAMFENGKFLCGGSLIDPWWVLTAAHCINTSFLCTPRSFSFRVGSVNISNTSDVRQEKNAQGINVHPDYDFDDIENNDNDLALVKMEEPFDLEDYQVNTICLPVEDMDDRFIEGQNATITGWGFRKIGGNFSDSLYEAIVPIYNWTKCTQSSNLQRGGFVTENMICAGYDDGRADACQGDSGGPLAYQLETNYTHQYFQIGVVSWGYECGYRDSPGVYTRLTRYEDWIRSFVTAPTQNSSATPCPSTESASPEYTDIEELEVTSACDSKPQGLSTKCIIIIALVYLLSA